MKPDKITGIPNSADEANTGAVEAGKNINNDDLKECEKDGEGE